MLSLFSLGLAMGLSGCGQTSSAQSDLRQAFQAEPQTNQGDANRGVQVFSRLPCLSCHTFKGSESKQYGAPPLDHIAQTAAGRLSGVNAAQYIRHALLKPQDLRVEGYAQIMPGFGTSLSSNELDDLIAYLLTLK